MIHNLGLNMENKTEYFELGKSRIGEGGKSRKKMSIVSSGLKTLLGDESSR